MLRYFIYGEVFFATTQRRTQAARRLDQRVSAGGFEPLAWQGLIDAYGAWPAGREDITVGGLPGLRLCYSTLDATAANAAVEDIAAAWDVFDGSDSWWSYTAVPA